MTAKNTHQPPAVGDAVTFRKTMTVAEQALFTGMSGNLGGLYVDRARAVSAGLTDMAVFELAAASLLSTCLSRLAGPGYRIAAFETSFHRAVPVGTTLEAQARLEADEGERLVFALVCRTADATVLDGRATMVAVAAG